MIKDDLKAAYQLLMDTELIEWVDEDYGQIDNYEVRPPVKFPCALVSLTQLADHQGGNEYDRSNTFTIRLAHDRLADRPANAPEFALERTMEKLVTANKVIDAFIDAGYYYLGYETERRADGISVAAVRFRITV